MFGQSEKRKNWMETLKVLDSLEVSLETILAMPTFKFKTDIRNLLIEDGIKPEHADSFIKSMEVDIGEDFIKDKELYNKAVNTYANYFIKVYKAYQQSTYDFSHFFAIVDNSLEITY